MTSAYTIFEGPFVRGRSSSERRRSFRETTPTPKPATTGAASQASTSQQASASQQASTSQQAVKKETLSSELFCEIKIQFLYLIFSRFCWKQLNWVAPARFVSKIEYGNDDVWFGKKYRSTVFRLCKWWKCVKCFKWWTSLHK